MAGIAAVGVEVPQGRLSREALAAAWGTPALPGERAVAAADEDALTLAVEAGRRALSDGGGADALIFATTTSPYTDKSVAAVLATAMRLPDDLRTAELTGGGRCGLEALRMAADLVDAGSARRVLVVVSERRLATPGSAAEQTAGDAAVALVIDENAGVARIEAWGEVTDDLTARWSLAGDRLHREFEPRLEVRHGLTEAVAAAATRALAAAGIAPGELACAILPGPGGRAGSAAADKLGIGRDRLADLLTGQVGDAGAASPMLALAAALPRLAERDRVLVAAHGDGASAAVLTRGPAQSSSVEASLLRRREVASYEEYAAPRGLIEGAPDGGAESVEVSPVAYWRRRRAILAREGARCQACGTVQFPPAPACTECACRALVPVELADTGVVYTFTNDHLVGGAYLEQPLARCVIDLDGGGRFYTTMTDCDPSLVRVGMQVELTFRLRSTGGGFRNYGWKCRPAEVTV